MKFSIITVTFNAEAYLEETLASVASQNFKDFEHIVWDGGSTDSTLQIVRKFPQVHLFSGKDKGISDAMNKGASYAQGSYLLHLHADDRLAHPQVLTHLHTALVQHPSTYWLYGRTQIIDAAGTTLRIEPFFPHAARKLCRYNTLSHPSTLVSRELFLKVGGFDTQLRYCMDYDLWLRLLQHATPFPFPGVISAFRAHIGSLSTSRPLEVAHEAYQVRNRYIRTLWQRYRSYRTWQRRIKN